ncbi:protein of unknown function [Pseudorhizobium banfieldiae]|uniref:Uncharacterized protein n=1 Tax=Pseudorhizobium banfieldiae TaxID=1125847 RepID=L0NIV9_9HYPH|nr:protein of unknown function [Pseudorhizobium banfieldiae]
MSSGLNPKPNQHALIFKDFSRTKDIVASSAAALVGERFIVPTPKTSQHGFSKTPKNSTNQLTNNRNSKRAAINPPQRLLEQASRSTMRASGKLCRMSSRGHERCDL